MIRNTHSFTALAAVLALSAMPAAAAETFFTLDARGDVGYDSNPFLAEGGDTAAATFGLRLTPQFTARAATSTTVVTGTLARTEYSRRFDAAEDYGIDLSHQNQVTERLGINLNAGISDTRSSFLEPEDLDINAAGRRRRSYDVGGSFSWQQDARSSWTGGASFQRSEYPGDDLGLSDFDSLSGNLAYNRVLSSQTTVGIQMAVTRTTSDFYPDSTIYQPRLTLVHQFNEAWSLDAGVGVSFQRSRFNGRSDNSRTLAASANLCRTDPRSTLCVGASRDTAPSGLGGTQRFDQVSADYSYRLTELGSARFNASYSRSRSENFTAVSPDVDYAQATASYEHTLSPRTGVGVSASYRYRDYDRIGSTDGYGGTVFLRHRFGRTQ